MTVPETSAASIDAVARQMTDGPGPDLRHRVAARLTARPWYASRGPRQWSIATAAAATIAIGALTFALRAPREVGPIAAPDVTLPGAAVGAAVTDPPSPGSRVVHTTVRRARVEQSPDPTEAELEWLARRPDPLELAALSEPASIQPLSPSVALLEVLPLSLPPVEVLPLGTSGGAR